ncbi:MAG: T9SS type A sorting domain-containing protein [Planctomycetia bacterium]|nr:T9SS type A sorting domain-containing protein [Planctomycetia bacterium]
MRYILIIIYLLNLLCAQNIEPKVAPLSPNFIKYQEDKKKGLIHNINSEGYYNSIIPHPTDNKIETPRNYKVNILLPERYDLRDEGFVTPVKNQGQCGACWIFATMGAIESYWKKLLLINFGLSENHAALEHGFEGDPCEGGNAKQLTAYLIRGDGPKSEVDYPYVLGKELFSPLSDPQGIVTDARFLPNDMDVIKQCITDYGGLYSSFRWFGDFYDHYNQTDNTYFYSSIDTDTTDAGHAIVLVGWDDNMQTAGGIGAWIIKNSWGNNFGENGYFYISYQDVFLHSGYVACWPGRQDYNEHSSIYYYDRLGHLADWGWGDDGIDYALVKYTIQNNETLFKVGTYTVRGNSQLSFDIWDNFNNGVLSTLLGNTSVAKVTNVNNCDYPGYYTYDITNPIAVTAGDDIYIRVKYQTPGYGTPIPIEMYSEDYANPQIEAEGFWISSDGVSNSWFQASGKEDYPYDPCIKLYTTETAWIATEQEYSQVTSFYLNQNYPNPFNPSTTITFDLSEDTDVKILIYDMTGRLIRELVNQTMTVGNKTINWDGKDDSGNTVSGGVYLYNLQTGDYSQTKKMVLMK